MKPSSELADNGATAQQAGVQAIGGRSLRIALVTTFYPPWNFGGDGIYVRRLAHSLARLGCEVTVLHDIDAYRSLAPKDRRHPAPLDEPHNVRRIGLESGFGMLSPLLTQQLGTPVLNAGRISKILEDDFDVIHYHNVSLVGGPAILSMGKDAVKLYTAHEHWLVCPTHILWRYNRELCVSRDCLKCQLAYKRPPQLWRSLGLLEKHARSIDAFIALSESSARNHREFGFSQPMRVLPSFLPEEMAPAIAPPHPNNDRPYILFAGRLEAIKGLQEIIPQFTADGPADLLIAGSGDYEGKLRSLAADRPTVKFLGRMPPEDLTALYHHATALMASSVCYEVLPLVALEALRSGTPIIARNLGSYPEVIQRSGAGLLFDTPDQVPLLINRLLEEPGLRDRLTASGRRKFREIWSERPSLATYFELIEEIARNKNKQGSARAAQEIARSLSRPDHPGNETDLP